MKIAFLFLLIDNPNFSDLWDEYFKNNNDKINIYIHPKYPEKHTWKPKNIIKNIKKTSWGCIVGAYIELLKEAFKNKDNYKFVVMSESCVPIKNFDKFYNEITKNNRSWIKFMPLKKYDLKERIEKHAAEKGYKINKTRLFKHYARFSLNRKHTEELLELDKKNKLDFFKTMHVGDEFFLSSLVIEDRDVKNFLITYDDWEYVNNKKNKLNKIIESYYEKYENTKNEKYFLKIKQLQEIKKDLIKNPKSIKILSEKDLYNINSVESFFYRKFTKDSDIRKYWYKIIN